MLMLMIITVSILFWTVQSIIIDPINQTCVDPASYTL